MTDEDDPSLCARGHDQVAEVYGPVLDAVWGRQGLRFHPLHDEVSQDLPLDRRAQDLSDVVFHELCCPLGHLTQRVTDLDYLVEHDGRHHHDVVALEVVHELAFCDEQRVN